MKGKALLLVLIFLLTGTSLFADPGDVTVEGTFLATNTIKAGAAMNNDGTGWVTVYFKRSDGLQDPFPVGKEPVVIATPIKRNSAGVNSFFAEVRNVTNEKFEFKLYNHDDTAHSGTADAIYWMAILPTEPLPWVLP